MVHNRVPITSIKYATAIGVPATSIDGYHHWTLRGHCFHERLELVRRKRLKTSNFEIWRDTAALLIAVLVSAIVLVQGHSVLHNVVICQLGGGPLAATSSTAMVDVCGTVLYLIRRKIVDLVSKDHLCMHLQRAYGSHGPTRATTTLVLNFAD
eukprot:Skav225282  [mRNA]  locus=scaffold4099:249764:251413:- [translate_table: standard]